MRTGSCLCGDVAFRFEPGEGHSSACHCQMCRKWTGGVFISVPTEADAFELDAQDTLATHASSPWAERAFCSKCGSSLWYRVTAPGPHANKLYIGLGVIDDPAGLTLGREIFIDRKPNNYEFGGDTVQLTEAEVMAQFAGD